MVCIDFSPDSKLLVSAAQDLTVRLWSLDTGEQLRILVDGSNFARTACFLPDGKHVLVGAGTNLTKGSQLAVHDIETGRRVSRFGGSKAVDDLALSRDGRVLATADGWAHIWNMDTRSEKATYKEPGAVECVALSPDGKVLLTGNEHGIVTVGDLEKGELVHRPMHAKEETGQTFAQVTSVAISADGAWAASGGWSKRVYLWKLSGDTVHYWDLDHWVSGLAFGPTGSKVYASCWSGVVVELTPPEDK